MQGRMQEAQEHRPVHWRIGVVHPLRAEAFMSIRVMTSVFDRYPNGGGEMLLALALADHAHDDGSHVYPSIEQLAKKTRQSERTVQYQLRKMEESGWLVLENSGNGGRNQRREYHIDGAWIKGAEIAPLQKSAIHDIKGATDDIKGATDDVKGATDDTKGCKPLHPHRTISKPSEPSVNHKAPSPALPDMFDGIAKQVVEDFKALRKAKRAAITPTAINGIRREAAKAGITLEAALAMCCERGWSGFKADWAGVQPPDASAAPAKPTKFDPVAHVNRNRKKS